MNTFLFYFLIFIIYSFLGWVGEVTYGYITEKKIVNRGFMIGPVCPIYGVGALLMMVYLTKYKEDILTVFILSAVIGTILEYITSYLMEKIFNVRWWDYSNFNFNINGRVCLIFSCLFGLAGVITICIINPVLIPIIEKIPSIFLNILSVVFMILFIIDYITSFNITNKVRNTVKNISKDCTSELNTLVREELKNKALQSRLINAFPKYNYINRQKNEK